MYQIQVRRYDSEVWTNYGRPWLTKEAALDQADTLSKSTGIGYYYYQIVEV